MAKTRFRIWEQRLWEPARWQGQASLRVLSVLFGSSVLPFFYPRGLDVHQNFTSSLVSCIKISEVASCEK